MYIPKKLYHQIRKAFNWFLSLQHIRVKMKTLSTSAVTNISLDYEAEVSSNILTFRYIYNKLIKLVLYMTTYIPLKCLSRIFSRNNFLLENLSL